MQPSNTTDVLNAIRTSTDFIDSDSDGTLMIDGCNATELLESFGSPLNVVVEKTLRANYRRVHTAFATRWPANVNVMYAIKANSNPVIRSIVNDEGAGGDCFSAGEVYATFQGGASPETIAMNGSDKSEAELRLALDHGVCINIDDEEEIDALESLCEETGKSARVNLRLKILPDTFANIGSDYMKLDDGLRAYLAMKKWGYSVEKAASVTTKILTRSHLKLEGFSSHTGRFTQDPNAFAVYTKALAEAVVGLCMETGAPLKVLDIGGGFPRERDPESACLDLNPHTIEEFAKAVVDSMLPVFEKSNITVPELWLEPGRYIAGNAGILLGRFTSIKQDLDTSWTHIDISTNNLMRIDTNKSAYHVLCASGMDRPFTHSTRIVGPTCVVSLISADQQLPNVSRGEPVAVLDAGMYAESVATQFNSVPRPATVLVLDGQAELIKERERIEDVFSKCRTPERFRPMTKA